MVGIVGVAGTVFIAGFAFWLSFTALTHLAVRAGIAEGQAWAWPLIVDGVIVVATVAVVALAGRRGTGYAWGLLVCGAVVSVTANAIQAMLSNAADMPGWLAASVAAVPPVVLLAITHMTVILTRHDTQAVNGQPDVQAPPSLSDDAPTDVDGLVADQSAEPPTPVAVPDAGSGKRSRTWQKERAAALHADGVGVALIAAEVGVHPTTVSRWLKQHSDTQEADHE
jgi:hypothetical protein